MLAIMVVTATMSAFLSNTGTTAALLPVVVGPSVLLLRFRTSRQLMPLAFAAGIGGYHYNGWYTLPNIIVSGTLTKFANNHLVSSNLPGSVSNCRNYRIHDAYW